MGALFLDNAIIHGNFAELLPEKPKDMDYDKDYKWLEDYPFDWRETLGGTICSCKRVKVHYAPYYGYDYFHLDTCNLMRKLKDNPGINNLMQVHLPAITKYEDSVPVDSYIPTYIRGIKKTKGRKIKVEVKQKSVEDTLSLFDRV